MDVSIIIVTYNTCQMTGECIDSIIEHTRDVEYEIILVDNASRDSSKQTFSTIRASRIFIMKRTSASDGPTTSEHERQKAITSSCLTLIRCSLTMPSNILWIIWPQRRLKPVAAVAC